MTIYIGIFFLAILNLWLFNSLIARLLNWAQCGDMKARSKVAAPILAIAAIHVLIVFAALIGMIGEYYG